MVKQKTVIFVAHFNISMEIKLISYRSPDYEQMINLRMEILRKPLGLTFTDEQLAAEANDYFVGAFDNDGLLGCCVLTPKSENEIQLRQMAVQQQLQGRGVGAAIINFAEQLCIEKGFSKLMMHARNTAVPFYQKLGYNIEGNEFEEVGISHYKMEKDLSN